VVSVPLAPLCVEGAQCQRLLEKGLDPDTVLSGRDVVVAASRFFSMYPEAKLRNPPSTEASQNLKAALLSYEEDKK